MKKTAKIITACAVCVAAAGMIAYVISLSRQDGNLPEVENVTEVTTPPTEPTTEAESLSDTYGYVSSPSGMTEKAKIFTQKNKDYIGWISIDNTPIDYPIMLDPGENEYGGESYTANEYYLSHSIDGEDIRQGTLFMDYRDVFGSSETLQSENIVIYGHNMANNTMFGSLRKYRQDYSFYDESPFIELSSNYKDYQYVIFGLMITSGNWYSDFCYWNMEELDTEDDFNSYVNTVKNSSLIDTGVDVSYGDKLLTLSTCYADEDNSRFIVVARRLRDDEVENDFTSIKKTAENEAEQKDKESADEN
jgi:sortase B